MRTSAARVDNRRARQCEQHPVAVSRVVWAAIACASSIRSKGPRRVSDAHPMRPSAASVHELVLATLDHGIPDMLDPSDREHVTLIPAY